jgi:hypothetical protein
MASKPRDANGFILLASAAPVVVGPRDGESYESSSGLPFAERARTIVMMDDLHTGTREPNAGRVHG